MGVSWKAIKNILSADKLEVQNPTQVSVISTASTMKYSQLEYKVLRERAYTPAMSRNRSQNTDLTQIISYLRPTHEHSVLMVQDIERLKALAPEINQAENVLVSSIMSPNDLQDADPIINIDDLPNLSLSTKEQIEELLKDFQ